MRAMDGDDGSGDPFVPSSQAAYLAGLMGLVIR